MSSERETCTGQLAIDRLAELWAFHDSRISKVSMDATGSFLNVRLICIPRNESTVAEVIIDLHQVTRFELSWNVQSSVFYSVIGYTVILRDSGDVYISLDPYDDRAGLVDERDGDVIEARDIAVSLVMRGARAP